MVQLRERSPLTSEACSSNPVIGKDYIEHLLTFNCIEKTKKIIETGRQRPFKNTNMIYCQLLIPRNRLSLKLPYVI